jgi:hypothetical protein
VMHILFNLLWINVSTGSETPVPLQSW